MPLLQAITESYEARGHLNNNQLYQQLIAEGHIAIDDLSELKPIGKSSEKHSVLKRKIRWYQQTLKTMGIIEHTGQRGQWRNQPHGIGHQERKLKWINPYVKGKDLSELINKPYVVQ